MKKTLFKRQYLRRISRHYVVRCQPLDTGCVVLRTWELNILHSWNCWRFAVTELNYSLQAVKPVSPSSPLDKIEIKSDCSGPSNVCTSRHSYVHVDKGSSLYGMQRWFYLLLVSLLSLLLWQNSRFFTTLMELSQSKDKIIFICQFLNNAHIMAPGL